MIYLAGLLLEKIETFACNRFRRKVILLARRGGGGGGGDGSFGQLLKQKYDVT